MSNKEKQSIEHLGYEFMARFCIKLGRNINKAGNWFIKQASNLRFEQYKLAFGEFDDDIYIATYPKSGTTLMQVILYQLTTSGNMDFEHIYDVSPWIRNASFRNQKPKELKPPRLIKTHDGYKEFPRGTKGRFIHVHRNGKDVAVSLYNQQKDYNNNYLKFDKFLEGFLKKKAWFKYSKQWFENKKGLNILHIHYEDLLEDKHKEILRIVNFLGLDVDEQTIARAIKYSSFDYMKKHESKFGEQPSDRKKHEMRYNNFIRKGKKGEGDNLFNEQQKEQFNKYYKKIVAPFEN